MNTPLSKESKMPNGMFPNYVFRPGDSLGEDRKLRDRRWKTIEIQGITLFYTKEGENYCFCHGDPKEILPVGTRKYTLYWAVAQDLSKPKGMGNIDSCTGCTSIRDNGDRNSSKCIHILAARKLAFNQ